MAAIETPSTITSTYPSSPLHGDLEVFRENRAAIEQREREKYAAGDTVTDGSKLIHSGEFAKPRAARK
jgi:hypothetical protein